MDFNTLKIRLLKLLDGLAGTLLCELLQYIPNRRETAVEKPRRILVIRPGGIGDAVLLIPAIRLLRDRFPDSVIDVLAEKRNGGVFKELDSINNLYFYDSFPSSGLLAVLAGKYDLVIDTEQWHRLSAVISFLTFAPERTGFGTNNRRNLFTRSVEYYQDTYEAQSFIYLVNAYLEENNHFEYGKPFITPDMGKDRGYRKELNKYSERFSHIAGIFPGATVRERRWGIVNYSELIRRLVDSGTGIVLLGGPGDMRESSVVNRILFDYEILDFTGKTSLGETMDIISSLDVFVSADTGLMHIAYAVGTKTVSLFGAGIEDKWAPRGEGNAVINKNLFCSPCTRFGYTPSCPYDVRCLKLINVDEVFNKVAGMLE